MTSARFPGHPLQGIALSFGEQLFPPAPIFETSPGPYDWLGRSVMVGSGEKHADHSVFNYFVVLECGLPSGTGTTSGHFCVSTIFY
jgi:hypothetical protein